MLNHAPGEKGSTAENKGDASEPVLSAAVVAKLIKRGSDNIEDITADDVKFVFNVRVNLLMIQRPTTSVTIAKIT